MMNTDNIIQKLSDVHSRDYRYIPFYHKRLPCVGQLKEIVDTIREIVFPGYFNCILTEEETVLQQYIKENLESLYKLLSEQIYDALSFQSDDISKNEAEEKAVAFINTIPEIKRLLSTDVKAIFNNDPAAKNYGEIIFCYPSIKALLNHRVAHELFLLKIPLIPRIISEMAHSETGIDIHPGAKIGEYFSIDHGTGIVIGQTSIIGNHVCLYQGVTLGAKSFTLDEEGNPVDLPRHPILEDHVTVYSNSSILGRITIGEGTIVGGNVWLTHSVPPNSRIVQFKAIQSSFSGGLGI